MRAANSIWDVKEGRPVWKTIPLRLGVTVLTLVLLTAAAVAVTITVTGPLAPSVGRLVGVGGRVVTVWDVAKWPVPLLVIGSIVALL